MNRLPDWQQRMEAAVALASRVPFAWGAHDCVTFAAYVLTQMTGRDFMREYRTRYQWHSAREAAVIIARQGGLDALVDEFVGAGYRVAPLLLQRGDLALADNHAGHHVLALHDGESLIVPDEDGLTRLPLGYAHYGWRIG